MLRATNVPMKWADFDVFEGEEFEFSDLGTYATQNALGYTVHTYPEPFTSDYVYRVVVSAVPSAACRRIINMNPTDVDLIKVADQAIAKPSGSSAIASDCVGDIIDMAFYFDAEFKNPNSSSSSSGGSSSSSSSSSSSARKPNTPSR